MIEWLPRLKRDRWLAGIALAVIVTLIVAPVGHGESAQAARQSKPRVSREIMHWWNSPSEAAAMAEIRGSYEARGLRWIESRQTNRSAMRHNLVERLAGGVPPLANLWQAGSDFPQVARSAMFRDVDAVARQQQWDRQLLPAVRDQVRVDGRYFFAPTNVHGDNWLFFNAALLRRHGIAEPRSMDEALSAMEALDRAGLDAVALGQSEWEAQVAFAGIMLAHLDRSQYDRLYRRHDATVLDSKEGRAGFAAFDRFRRLAMRSKRRTDWADAARAVGRGEAGFQILGDYAKAEILRTGVDLERDIGCLITSPASTGQLVVIDGFVFPLDRNAPEDQSHLALAATIMQRDVQQRVARAKGALPARADAISATPDKCERQMIARLRQPGSALGDPLGALGPERVATFNRAVGHYFLDPRVSREQAVREIAAAFGARVR